MKYYSCCVFSYWKPCLFFKCLFGTCGLNSLVSWQEEAQRETWKTCGKWPGARNWTWDRCVKKCSLCIWCTYTTTEPSGVLGAYNFFCLLFIISFGSSGLYLTVAWQEEGQRKGGKKHAAKGSEVENWTPDSCVEDCSLRIWGGRFTATQHNSRSCTFLESFIPLPLKSPLCVLTVEPIRVQ